MDAPQEEFYTEHQAETLMILFRIISRDSWSKLQAWHESVPGSRVEHLVSGLYVLHVPPGGARAREAEDSHKGREATM
jgi:hypothetical protein